MNKIKLNVDYLFNVGNKEKRDYLINYFSEKHNNISDKLNKASCIGLTEVEIEVLKYEKALCYTAFQELTVIRASTYRKLITEVLDTYSSKDKFNFFSEKLGIEFCNDYEYHNNRDIKAATVEIETADNYFLIAQKTDCKSSDIYELGDTCEELYYNEPCEVKFLKENLEIGATYYCMDNENFFQAVSEEPTFIDEIALYLTEAAAEELNVSFKNDLNEQDYTINPKQ